MENEEDGDFQFSEFVADMQRYEEIFPDVRIVVEIEEEAIGHSFYVEIAGNIKNFTSYPEVREFLDSFIGKDLPKDPRVKVDREKLIKDSYE